VFGKVGLLTACTFIQFPADATGSQRLLLARIYHVILQ